MLILKIKIKNKSNNKWLLISNILRQRNLLCLEGLDCIFFLHERMIDVLLRYQLLESEISALKIMQVAEGKKLGCFAVLLF